MANMRGKNRKQVQVSLTLDEERAVQSYVKAGLAANRSDLIRRALNDWFMTKTKRPDVPPCQRGRLHDAFLRVHERLSGPPLNEHPLNQAALPTLKNTGVDFREDQAYLLQLAEIGLVGDKGEPADATDQRRLVLADVLSRGASYQLDAVKSLESELEPDDVLTMPAGELADLIAFQLSP